MYAGPACNTRGGPEQRARHKSLVCYVAQENSKEESNAENKKEVTAKKDTQVTTKKKLEEVDLGTDLQKPRSISISLKLLEDQRAELILLLKEFRDFLHGTTTRCLGLIQDW